MTMKLLPGCRLLDKLSRNKDLRATSIFITVYLMGTLIHFSGKKRNYAGWPYLIFSIPCIKKTQQKIERRISIFLRIAKLHDFIVRTFQLPQTRESIN